MRILLDTNILIHREANRVINQDIGIYSAGLISYITKNVYILYQYMKFKNIKTQMSLER